MLGFITVSNFIFFFLHLQEVLRIKEEHPNDSHCIVNDRVKGRLKVTRAFGAGYLKQVCSDLGLFTISSLLLFLWKKKSSILIIYCKLM